MSTALRDKTEMILPAGGAVAVPGIPLPRFRPEPTARVLYPDKLPREAARVRRAIGQASPATWATMDLSLVLVATGAVHKLLIGRAQGFDWIANPWIATIAFCASIVGAGIIFGLYDPQTLLARSRILVRSGVTVAVGVALAYAFLSVLLHLQTSRWLGLAVLAAHVVIAIPLRLVAHHLITTSRINLLYVGAGDAFRKIVTLIDGDRWPQYRIVGHVRVPHPQEASSKEAWYDGVVQRSERALREVEIERICPYLGTAQDLGKLIADYQIDEVIVDARLTSDPSVGDVVLHSLEKRCRITDQSTFVEKLLGEVPAEDITAQWFLLADVFPSGTYEIVKRVVDVVCAALGLILTAPLWPLAALAIRLDSRGKVIYSQIRVGQHGRQFAIYKFRTMRENAEAGGARWATVNDDRVTRVGRFLRRSRIDEIPQLWNILRGDMSLVGPRPERPEFVDRLSSLIPHYRQRHLIKPGLTGWAQIHYPYGASVRDAHRKLCFDLYYLKHRSIDMDFGVIIRTLGTFLMGSR